MPIEFACENCARTLRVPDGSSGKKSQCPACGRSQEIPYVVTSNEPHPDNRVASTDGKLSIPCPNCKHHLICSPELLGTRGQCRKCQHIFTIATEPEKAPPSETPELVFSCPKCQQLFEGKAEMEGRSGRCHVCHAVFTIELRPAETVPVVQIEERPSPAPSATKQSDGPVASSRQTNKPTGAKAPTKNRTSQPAPQSAQQSPIQFMCVHCRGLMEVPGSSAGLDTACPYCQTVQTIPAASASTDVPTQTQVAHSDYSGSRSTHASNSDPRSSFESLGSQLDPFTAVNPYASAPHYGWQAPARSSNGLTFGNVFRTAFEGLFPSCLFTILHTIVFMGTGFFVVGFMLVMLFLLAGLKLGPQAMLGASIILYGIFTPVGLAIVAWFSSSIRHMALLAIRKHEFDASKAFSPGGAYNAAILIAFVGVIFQQLMRAPKYIEFFVPGAIGALALPWVLVVLVFTILFLLSTSLVLFAAIDGDDVGEAIVTSFRLVFSNLPLMVAVKLLVWIMTIVLFIPTFGLSLTLPIYFNATLYHLARQEE